MSITLTALQKQRRDTAANWTTANPTLLAGEIGIESDTGYWKVGDGSTAWTSLAYLSGLGAEIPVSRLADGTARQLLQTAANGTDVEWTSNIDVPGTLDVTGAATFDAAVTTAGLISANGRVSFPLGSAAAPSLYPGSDTNTGIYSPGADQVAVATNGTARLYIASDGKVGVGTTSPAYPLDLGTSNDGRARLWFATTSFVGDQGDSTGFQIRVLGAGTSGMKFANYANNVEYGRFDSSGRLGIGTSSPAERLHITGNMRLAGVAGATQTVFAEINANNLGTTVSPGVKIVATTGSTTSRHELAFYTTSDNAVNTTEKVRIDASGRVGIGNNAPDTTLTVGGTNAAIRVQPSNVANAQIFLRHGSIGNNSGLEADNTGALAFYANGSERSRIDNSGRLLVGTSSARSNFYNSSNSSTLQIEGVNDGSAFGRISTVYNDSSANGTSIIIGKTRGTSAGAVTVLASGDSIGTLSFQGADGTELVEAASIRAEVDGTPGANDMPGRLVFSTTADGASSPTERMRISSSGLLYSTPTYNSTTTNAANLFVSSTGEFARSTSSIKYKADVETLQDFYADAVLNCRPVWYRSTTGNDNPDWGWWGFIAEEVAAIDPRLVFWKTTETSYDEKGSVVATPLETPEPEGVQYDRFVPHLLNLIKRQQQAIETLEAKVAALESQ